MGIESEAERDLSLPKEEAESVSGGRMLKKQKGQSTHHHPKPEIIRSPGLPSVYTDVPDVDPVADEEGT